MGVFACRAIKRGERILSEAPLVQWTLAPGDKTNAGLVALVNGLSPSDRSIYDSLSQNEHAHGAHKSIYGIWLTNALVATAGLKPTRARTRGHVAAACAHCDDRPFGPGSH